MNTQKQNSLLIIIALSLGLSLLAMWPQKSDLSQFPSAPSLQYFNGATRLVMGLKIPLHRAHARDLAYLTGLGEVRAQAITDFLKQNGPITDFDALLQVPGIGPKTLAKIKPYLEL